MAGFTRTGDSCIGAVMLARSASVTDCCPCSGMLPSGCLDACPADWRSFLDGAFQDPDLVPGRRLIGDSDTCDGELSSIVTDTHLEHIFFQKFQTYT